MDHYPNAHSHQFQAMGCQIQLWLDYEYPEVSGRLFGRVESYFSEVEKALSRFQPQSELSQLNLRTGQWTAVSPLLWDVLSEALTQAELTNGLFDPTMLGALEAAGYVDSFEKTATKIKPGPPGVKAASGQWQNVQLDSERQAVWLPLGGRIDLGGMAKGYTAAHAVEMLSVWGPCLVDAGGDVVAGKAPVGWPGWPVAIASPGKEETANLMTLWLEEATLATSGIDFRHWQHNGHFTHHIIDPRTGRPAATDLLSVSVLLKQAVQAEVVATAVLVIGKQAGLAWLADRQIPALLVSRTGATHMTPALEAAYSVTPL